MHRATRLLLIILAVMVAGFEKPSVSAFQAAASQAATMPGRLIVYGDVTLFLGKPGLPGNCALQSRFKRGDPVGFRMTAFDSETGKMEPSAQFVIHLSYAGTTQDLKMRYRGTVKQPEREFWVAKWMVPADAPVGIVRYTVTATDKYGRTGEFKPFVVDDSQITIVE